MLTSCRSSGRSRALLVFVLLAVAVPLHRAEAVVINPGDIIVSVDEQNGGSIVRVDPITGVQTVIATDTTLNNPWGVAIDSAGQIVVTTLNNGVIRVDPRREPRPRSAPAVS